MRDAAMRVRSTNARRSVEEQAMSGGALAEVRLAHFSDVHVTAADCTWRRPDWFNKRLSAWVNLRLLGRGHRFRHADRVLTALAEDLRQRDYQRLLFSGDATALGFEEEMARAAALLGVGRPDLPPGLAVPGNHDYMTRHAAKSGHFERDFAAWQRGERVGEAIYPFAQRVGPAWIIAVNSAYPNRWAWDASGRVGPEQLDRLERLLERLQGGPRVLVTHYPVWLANGRRERPMRALRDLDDLVEVCVRGGISLWLHGHRHHNYHTPPADPVPFPVICAGSATQHGRWSYKDYTLVGYRLKVLTRVFDNEQNRFADGNTYELTLPGAPAAAALDGSASR
jgi:3',5'-cyclic AMP phosphodiesterase CpdA